MPSGGKSVIVIERHQGSWHTPAGSLTSARAGHDGGRIVFQGTPADLAATRATLTGEHLAACAGT